LGSPPGCAPMTARQAGEFEVGRLLQRIEIDGGAGSYASAADIVAAVRAILKLVPGGGGGPSPTSALSVRPDDAQDTLASIARIWATEVLPELLRRDNETACCGPSPDRCVLLADVDIDVGADGTVAGGDGVLYGFEVTLATNAPAGPESNATVHVAAGLAFNLAGEAAALRKGTDVRLTTAVDEETPEGRFTVCEPPAAEFTNIGFY